MVGRCRRTGKREHKHFIVERSRVVNEACGLLPPPFSSCIPRALASTLFPLPSPTTPFPAVSSLSRSPSLSPLATLSPTTQLGVYLMCVCICAFFPPSQCIAAANNVAMYVYPSSFVSLDVPTTRGAQPPVYIPVLYARQLLRRDTRIGRTTNQKRGRSSVSGTANPIETVFQPTTNM